MARKRGKAKRRSRRRNSRAFNVINAAEMYLQTNVLTQGVAGTNPLTFLTGQETGTSTQAHPVSGRAMQVSSFGYHPSAASVTLPELFGVGNANPSAAYESMAAAAKANWMPILMKSVGIRIGFNIGKKLLSRQRSFINTKILPATGLQTMVKV